MALDHAILTSLAERAASGYDLTRRFDASIGFFWTATHQQIYRVLARLEAAQSVYGTVEQGHGRPDRKVYDLTPQGRAELAAWTATPSRREPLRSDLAVKVRALPFGDPTAIYADIGQQRTEHQQRLTRYEADLAANFCDLAAIPDRQLPVYLVLRGGIRQERSYVDWCDEMLTVLTERIPALSTTEDADRERKC
ncbi:MAG: PadR family transcriptional regulator [Actinomycetota bacterium]|nr:PadR family transcriptional regulator [Actinomycetota bacterium]